MIVTKALQITDNCGDFQVPRSVTKALQITDDCGDFQVPMIVTKALQITDDCGDFQVTRSFMHAGIPLASALVVTFRSQGTFCGPCG